MMYHKNYQTSWSIWLTILQKYTKVAIWIHLFFQGLHHRQPASVFFWCETFLTRPEMGFPQKPAISMDVFAQWWAKSMTKPAKYFWAVLNCGISQKLCVCFPLKKTNKLLGQRSILPGHGRPSQWPGSCRISEEKMATLWNWTPTSGVGKLLSRVDMLETGSADVLQGI